MIENVIQTDGRPTLDLRRGRALAACAPDGRGHGDDGDRPASESSVAARRSGRAGRLRACGRYGAAQAKRSRSSRRGASWCRSIVAPPAVETHRIQQPDPGKLRSARRAARRPHPRIVGDSVGEGLRSALQEALDSGPDLVLGVCRVRRRAATTSQPARLSELGELLVHGIAVRPGHPVIIGMIGTTPIIGVPGYPVSAALNGELLISRL